MIELFVGIMTGAYMGTMLGIVTAIRAFPDKFQGRTGDTGMPGPQGAKGDQGAPWQSGDKDD